jgi:hypothetical protein
MDVLLDDVALAWRNRAAEFASRELIPWEVEAELHEGKLPRMCTHDTSSVRWSSA